jgi:transketolase
MSSTTDYQELEALARKGRWLAISTVAGSGAGHVGGPFSAMDIMVALYFSVMKIKSEEPKWPERDRFILSKGHSSIGQYVVMALRGFLPIEELKPSTKVGRGYRGIRTLRGTLAWRHRLAPWGRGYQSGLAWP